MSYELAKDILHALFGPDPISGILLAWVLILPQAMARFYKVQIAAKDAQLETKDERIAFLETQLANANECEAKKPRKIKKRVTRRE